VGAELFRPEDRQDEDHDRFSQFWDLAWNLANYAWLQSSATKPTGTSLFRAIMQLIVVIPCRRFGTTSEMSVKNYHYSLRNSPEKRSSLLINYTQHLIIKRQQEARYIRRARNPLYKFSKKIYINEVAFTQTTKIKKFAFHTKNKKSTKNRPFNGKKPDILDQKWSWHLF
jgi:hypothetical protein